MDCYGLDKRQSQSEEGKGDGLKYLDVTQMEVKSPPLVERLWGKNVSC